MPIVNCISIEKIDFNLGKEKKTFVTLIGLAAEQSFHVLALRYLWDVFLRGLSQNPSNGVNE